MKPFHTIMSSLSALLLVAATAGSAAADQGPSEPRADRIERTGPNRSMLRSGLWTLGASYVPAAVVAMESSLPADDNLYIPVAGPWLDYSTRDCDTCEHENLNKVLLVTDGVVQGIGALQILGSFLFLETKPVTAGKGKERATASAAPTPRFKIKPAKLGHAFGVAASARF